jgi:hypothetical protein
MPDQYDVFVSYSTDDKTICDVVAEYFMDKGMKVWVDRGVAKKGETFTEQGIAPGAENWLHEILKAIDSVKIFVVLITPNSITRPIVSVEYSYAYHRRMMAKKALDEGQRTSLGFSFVPIYVGAVNFIPLFGQNQANLIDTQGRAQEGLLDELTSRQLDRVWYQQILKEQPNMILGALRDIITEEGRDYILKANNSWDIVLSVDANHFRTEYIVTQESNRVKYDILVSLEKALEEKGWLLGSQKNSLGVLLRWEVSVHCKNKMLTYLGS